MRALRRLLGVLALLGLTAAGVLVYRRRVASRRERADLYYESGLLLTLAEGSPGADRLLPLARDVLAAARS